MEVNDQSHTVASLLPGNLPPRVTGGPQIRSGRRNGIEPPCLLPGIKLWSFSPQPLNAGSACAPKTIRD